LAEHLAGGGIEAMIEAFGGESSSAEIDRLVALGQGKGICAVVGAGGGKASDTARAVADALGLPAVITPTLASTDSPCSALSVIYTPEGRVEGMRYYNRHPLLVLVDTEVVARAPKRQLVGGLGDALSTWFEARTVRESCHHNTLGGLPSTTSTALAKLCCEILLADGPAACAAVEARATTPALERVVEANNLLSGLGFESGGLAVAHAVHNGITEIPSSHNSIHGEKLAFGLLTQLVLEGRPQAEIADIYRYQKAVGLPITLAEVGVDANSDDQLRIIADRSSIPGESSHNEPFPVTASALVSALRAADQLGRCFV
jgi:glycerol dehydrogenase